MGVNEKERERGTGNEEFQTMGKTGAIRIGCCSGAGRSSSWGGREREKQGEAACFLAPLY
ncbi:hypothetical protein I656_02870 [Geobacillus sp. WSUCF1]|nr:hypothetical protein I656_02870 [Geobacillus sp. WSUCF1]